MLLLVELSAATLPFITQLQNNLHLLLNEQLSHTKEFNIVRYWIMWTLCTLVVIVHVFVGLEVMGRDVYGNMSS